MAKIFGVLNRAVIVSAFGYFVDIYDLILFSVVRRPSLLDIGVATEDLRATGILILNAQMVGMLLGGILWGVLGDKRGRLSVLFGSIFLYSIATVANAFVTDVPTYAGLRFVAGVGLAGELGAAITLVSEILPKETRGYGTAIVAAVGIMGAIAAGLVAKAPPQPPFASWQVAYLIGGVLGLVLLVARFTLYESGLYASLQKTDVRRGDLLLLLGSPKRALTYLHSVLIGLPLWFVIGILITFSPELGAALHVRGTVDAATAVMLAYGGLVLGDFASGFLSQRFRTRRGVVFAFITITALLFFAYILSWRLPLPAFYALCFALGVGAGYWAVFVTMAAEQFGTNLRATVATTVPNFIRGSVVLLTFAFEGLGRLVGLGESAMLVGAATFLIALFSLTRLEETSGKELDYVEA